MIYSSNQGVQSISIRENECDRSCKNSCSLKISSACSINQRNLDRENIKCYEDCRNSSPMRSAPHFLITLLF